MEVVVKPEMTREQEKIRQELVGKLYVLKQPYGVTYRDKTFSISEFPLHYHFKSEQEFFYVVGVDFCPNRPRNMILSLMTTKHGLVYSKWYGFRLEDNRLPLFFTEIKR